MPKTKTKLPKDLPAWANEPLKFTLNPDKALRRAAFAKLPKISQEEQNPAASPVPFPLFLLAFR